MTCNLKNNSSLHESIKTFNLDTVQRAFKTDPSSLNTLDPNIGWSTVYKAVVYEQYDIVKFLLEKGADPNLANKIGETPLHYAAEVGKEEFVRILLDYDANPNTKQSDGNTPFHIACKNDFSRIVKLMLRKQVNVNIQNKLGRTALHLVWQNNNLELCNQLLEYGADPDIKDKLGRKPQSRVSISTNREPEIKKAPPKHPEPSVVSITNSSRSSWRDETNSISEKTVNDDDKENNQNQAPRKSTRRKLSLGRPKDIKQRMSISTKSSSEQIGGGLQSFVKPPERILGDITNVMSLHHQPLVRGPQIQLTHHDEENKPVLNNNQTPRLLAIKTQVLKTLDIHPLAVQKAQSQNTSNTTPLQSPANSVTNQAKLTLKERMEALKQSCSNLAKHQPRKSISEHTFNSQNIDADLSSEDTQSTKSYQTQDGKPWSNTNKNLDAKPPQTESPSSPAPQQTDNHHLITPRLIQKEILTISAGKIFNNKLINIFCPTSPTSPKREDDFEFRRTESVYEINPLELQLQTTEVRMSDWLADLGLQDLRLNFVDNGYTSFDKFKRDYDDCKVILKDLLYRFGVDKIGHRCRIVMKLREESGQLTRRGLFRFNGIHSNSRLEFPKIKEWLSSLGYEEYLENFLDNGFDDLEYMILQTYFKEVVLDEFMMRDEIGIKNKQIRDDILKRLRHVYEIAIGMEPNNFDSDIFLNLLCNKDSDSNKNCNIF